MKKFTFYLLNFKESDYILYNVSFSSFFYSLGIKYIGAFIIYNPYGISAVKVYFCYKYIIPTE